jgi:hypothetical protein
VTRTLPFLQDARQELPSWMLPVQVPDTEMFTVPGMGGQKSEETTTMTQGGQHRDRQQSSCLRGAHPRQAITSHPNASHTLRTVVLVGHVAVQLHQVRSAACRSFTQGIGTRKSSPMIVGVPTKAPHPHPITQPPPPPPPLTSAPRPSTLEFHR